MKISEDMWKSVPLKGATADLTGLAAFEECSDYRLLKNKPKKSLQIKKNLKRKTDASISDKPKKQTKLDTSNPAFKVESVDKKTKVTPSKFNETAKSKKERIISKIKKIREKRKMKKKGEKKPKTKVDKPEKTIDVVAEPISNNVSAWSTFGIPEPILRALADQDFERPTRIQELTLPSAMLGKRDILGAAETGSGKTLAFGIPILSGILNIKTHGESYNTKNRRHIKKRPDDKKIDEEKKEKIVNMNKMDKKERAKLVKSIRKRKSGKKFVRKGEDDSESDDAFIDSDEDDDSGSEEEEEEEEEQASSDDNEEEEAGSDDNEEEKSNDEEMEETDDENNEDDDEEGSDDENEDTGCVKVVDNIPSNVGPFANLNPRADLKPLYALILTPTRELAIQVKNHLVAAAKYTDIKVAVVLGGMAQVKQERILSKGPEIVVATPGRLWELIQIGNDHLSQFADIKFLAIDETDRMIEKGHFEELHHILERLNDDFEKKQKRQNFVFSATLTMVHDLPNYLKIKKFKKGKVSKKKPQKLSPDQKVKQVIEVLGIMDPKIVDVTTKNQGASETLVECKILCSIDHKDYYLYYVLKRHPGRTIVFCNSIGCVKRLAQLFGILKCKPLPIHASMVQRQRLKNLDRFRDDPNGILIATDVAARGLDIPDVDHVIHYQVPRTAENYVHRSGRTARANKEGITILLIEPQEAQNYTKICKTLSKTEEIPDFPVPDPLLAATRQRVDLARQLDHLELRTRKTNSEVGWYEKAMQEMDIILDDKEMPKKFDKEETETIKMSLKMKKKQLDSLLNKLLFPKGFSYKFPTNTEAIDQVLKTSDKENAIDVMKNAIFSGALKNEKLGKNEAALMPEAQSTPTIADQPVKEVNFQIDGKVNKNKWKKLKRNHVKNTTN